MTTFRIGLICGGLLALCINTSGHDPSERHWVAASPDPDRIFLTFHGDPAVRRAVTWRTDDTVTQAVAEIAVALAEPGFAQQAVRVPAESEAIELTDEHNGVTRRVQYHSVLFTDLQPDTLYAYRVGDGEKRWSEWIQFRTASTEAEPFSFVYFGDAQNDVHSRWSRVIRMAARKAPEAAFALHAGDLINRADADAEWAGWFKAGSFLHAQWTGIPVAGNHEYKKTSRAGKSQRMMSMLWRPQFMLPVEETLPEAVHESVYTVEYQGVQLIVLNSNEALNEQTEWLKEQLQKTGFRWRVVSFHHPIFSPSGRSAYPPTIREAWKRLFNEYNVDLVLQGHDHTYVRGQLPALNADADPQQAFRTLYVTSVSGPKQYAIKDGQLESYEPEGFSTLRTGLNTQFFQVIRAMGPELSYQAYTATGELYDAAVIRKNFKSGKKQIRQQIPATETRTYENTAPYSRENL